MPPGGDQDLDATAAVLADLAEPLDRAGGLSLAAQLSWRLRRLMGSSTLRAGDRLPSARELARAVGVNVNTVFAVYGRLEQDGLIESQHGRGSFVRPGAERAADLVALADETAAAARAAGLDPRELALSVFVAPEARPAGQPSADPDELRERRALRAEISRLEHRLARLQPLSPASSGGGRAAPRLPDTAALRATRDALHGRIAALTSEREERYAAARARRFEGQSTTTLEHAGSASERQAGEPLHVRWTPGWAPAWRGA